MHSDDGLTMQAILELFREELACHGGKVADVVDDGKRLFTRGLLPRVEEARARDRLQGGVALKARGHEVWLHPYVFRLVCRNGAIAAQSFQSRHFQDLHLLDVETASRQLREAISSSCDPGTFADAARKIRSAVDVQADLALNMMPLISRFSSKSHSHIIGAIMDRFFEAADHSRFGLMNAVTSVARDSNDPDLRWELEEFGGAIGTGVVPKPRQPTAGRRQAMMVG